MNWISFIFTIFITILGLFATIPQIFNYCVYRKTRGISFFSILTEYLLYSVRSTYGIYLFYPYYNSCIGEWKEECLNYTILTFNNLLFSLLFLFEILLYFMFYEKERRNILRIEHIPVKRKCSYLFLYIPIVILSVSFNFLFLALFVFGFRSRIIFEIQDITIRILILIQGLPQLCHSLYYRFIGNVSLVSFLFLSLVSIAKTIFFAIYDTENQLWIYYLVSFFIQFPTFLFLVFIHVNYIKGNDPEVDFYLLSTYNNL